MSSENGKTYTVRVYIAEDTCGAIHAFTTKPSKCYTDGTHKRYVWAIEAGTGNAVILNSNIFSTRYYDENHELNYVTLMDEMGFKKGSLNIIDPKYEGIGKEEPVEAEISIKILPKKYNF